MKEVYGSGGRDVSPWTWFVPIALLLLSVGVASSIAVAQSGMPDTDNTVTQVELYPNGSAVWSVTVRTRLDSTERVAEYEAFQEGFRENTSSYLDPFRRRMTGVVSAASEERGREMEARDFRASTGMQEVPRRWGHVRYRFVWTGFAETMDRSILVGDVLQDGFYLSEDDRLEIRAPEGYVVSEVAPEPTERQDGVVVWTGREDFGGEEPRVELREEVADRGGTATSTVLAAIGVLVLLTTAGYLWRRKKARDSRSEGAGRGSEDAVVEDASSVTGDSPPVTDPERVYDLLDANDGRMRQSAIGEELGWSDSKTSRVTGSMEEDGRVRKLQMGRENVVELDTED